MEPRTEWDLSMYRQGRFQGRLDIAVALYTQVEFLRELGGLSLMALEKEEVIAVLETFLKQHGLWDASREAYEAQRADRIVGFEAY